MVTHASAGDQELGAVKALCVQQFAGMAAGSCWAARTRPVLRVLCPDVAVRSHTQPAICT